MKNLRDLITTIKSIIKVARMISADDSGNYRIGNFQYYGRTTQGLLFSPYGLLVNPPVNSMAVVLSQNGQESNPIALCDDPNNRTLKDLQPGEVALSNYNQGQYVYFKENGDAEIKADKAVILVGSTTVTIDNGQITIDGADMTLNGNLQVNGSITATGEVTAGTVNLTDHVHAGSPTAPSGPVSNTGIPIP
jgi:phage baseplate assembly protein V